MHAQSRSLFFMELKLFTTNIWSSIFGRYRLNFGSCGHANNWNSIPLLSELNTWILVFVDNKKESVEHLLSFKIFKKDWNEISFHSNENHKIAKRKWIESSIPVFYAQIQSWMKVVFPRSGNILLVLVLCKISIALKMQKQNIIDAWQTLES